MIKMHRVQTKMNVNVKIEEHAIEPEEVEDYEFSYYSHREYWHRAVLHDSANGLIIDANFYYNKDKWIDISEDIIKALWHGLKRAQRYYPKERSPMDYDTLISDALRLLSVLLMVKNDNVNENNNAD